MRYSTPYNINPKEKLLLISPPHTGSRRSVEITSKLGFSTFHYKNGKIVYYNQSTTHNDNYILFDDHEDYKIVMTVRNPYRILLSGYRSLCGNFKIPSTNLIKEDFTDFLYSWYLDNNDKWYVKEAVDNLKPLLSRGVDYRIRLESMLEGYKSIPFVKNHTLFLSGELESLCNTKVGNWESDPKLKKWNLPSDLNFFYNQKTADFVYDNTRHIFELFDYHKDSWKE